MLREGAGQMGPGEKAGVRLPVLALGVSVGTGWESPALQRGLSPSRGPRGSSSPCGALG